MALGASVPPPGAVALLQTGRVSALVFAPEEPSLFVATGERVEHWEWNTGKKVQEYRGHEGFVMCVALSPDGKRLYSGGTDGRILLWDVSSGRCLAAATAPVPVFALALGRVFLAAGLGNGKILFLDPQSLALGAEEATESSVVLALALDDRGECLAAAGDNGAVYIWHVPSLTRIGSFSAGRGALWSLALASGGGILATAAADGTVRLWSFPGGEALALLAGHRSVVWGMRFLENGEFLVSVSGDLCVRIWHVPTGEEVGVLRAHAAGVRALAVAGSLFASASEDGKIVVWDLKALLSLRPRVVQALYAREIQRSQHILVSFADANGDVVGVKLRVEEAYPGTVQLAPASSFDPKVRGRVQGTFGFTVTVSQPMTVKITVLLTDALGLVSPPYTLSFVVRPH